MQQTHNRVATATLVGGGLGILGGLWLLASPSILGYSGIGLVTLMVHGAPVVQDASSAPLVTYIGAVIILAMSAFVVLTAWQARFSPYRLTAGVVLILTGIVLMGAPYISSYTGVNAPLNNLQLSGAAIIIVAGFMTEAPNNRTAIQHG